MTQNSYTVEKTEETETDDKDVEIELGGVGDLEFEENCYTRVVSRIQDGIAGFWKTHNNKIMIVVKVVFFLLYLAYFSYCMYYRFGDEGSIRLMLGTIIGIMIIVYKLTPGCSRFTCLETFATFWGSKKALKGRRWTRRGLYLAFTIGAAVYIGLEVIRVNPASGQSLIGIFGFILFGFLISTNPIRVNWHPIFWGVAIQFLFAIMILRSAWGYEIFDWLGHRIEEFLNYGLAGAEFVFGSSFQDHRLAFSVMPVMLFFNSIIFLLYHIGVIQVIIRTLGTFLAFCMDTGPIESVVASANIFVGLTEAPLLVRPFLHSATASELHAIMTCGFASVSGGTLGMFVQFGAPANHLLSASVMSAPAALAVTKVMCPETKKSAFGSDTEMELGIGKHRNALSAIATGAVVAVKIAANTLANQIAFVSLLKFTDMTLGWFGARAGVAGLSFGLICSYVFFPVSYAMGVPVEDCGKMGSMLGMKVFGTPILGYQELGEVIRNREMLMDYEIQYNSTWSYVGNDILLHETNVTLVDGIISERSEVIGTYALCGFCTVTAIGVTLGTLIPMAPERQDDVIKLVVRALIAGNLASFMTGAIAGLLYNGGGIG